MNYRGETANQKNKYNNSLNDDDGKCCDAVRSTVKGVAETWEGVIVSTYEHVCINPVFMPLHI